MISPATTVHAEALASIHADCFGPGQAWSASAFASLLTSPGVIGLIEPRGGILLARRASDEAEILTIAVLPQQRRQRVGSTLLCAALARLAEAAVKRVFLEVAEGNEAALALYRRAGFERIGSRPSYYPAGQTALLLRLVWT